VLEEHGVSGQRVDGRSGVWLPRGLTHDKIAAIGIRVASGTSMHGFALNCNNSLDAYSSIIACGIRDAGVTTMSRVTGKQISPMDVLETVVQSFSKEFEVAHELS
jgi:lipoyl(octanoyl) transferase